MTERTTAAERGTYRAHHIKVTRGSWCRACKAPWPCLSLRLLDELEAARDVVEAVEAQPPHAPIVKDGPGYRTGGIARREA